MKYKLLILIIMTGFSAFPQRSYDHQWKKVDSLSGLGQPKTALEIVEKIYEETKRENNAPQFLKASIYKMALVSSFEEEHLLRAIQATESDILTATGPVRNILQSMLAELYWQYYQQNRYQFLNRTGITGQDAGDIRTWDLRTIVQKCILNFSASLENPDILKSTFISQYEPILVSHPESRSLRPTVYDFLVHRAIDFYMNSEAGLTQPAVRFLVDRADYFLPSADFSVLQIQTSDTISFEFQAVKLLQQVIAFHLDDNDPAALIDAELIRLTLVHDHCILPEKDSLYLSALQKLEKRFSGHPASTEIVYHIALQWISSAGKYQPLLSDEHKWDLKDAYQLLDAAILKFPESFGAANCKVLKEKILQRSIEITADYASIPGKPALALLAYKNTPKIFFRLMRTNPLVEKEMNERGEVNQIQYFLKKKADLEWSQALPDDGDFQPHKVEIRLPELKAGHYILLASTSADFSEEGIVALNRFWRTGISYISRRNDEGTYEIFVLGRQEGEPLPSVKVQSFFREYDYRSRSYNDRPGPVLFTDKDGYVTIAGEKSNRSNQYYLVFSTANDQLITQAYFSGYWNPQGEPRKVISTYFFTDRSIYRPGQTVYFKGIAIERQDKITNLKPGYKATVTLYDVNGQKVSSLEVVANEFGSFSGAFTTPQGVLTGSMTLQCETGSTVIQVEEYKRPKFEVTFNPITGSYRLGEEVTITGKALAYAGNTISYAQVSYRVVRTARFPYHWWGWREWLPESPETEIINGTTATDANGEFTVRFKAIPDPTVDKKFRPVFHYKVSATVADINSETHDGETMVSVGYAALLANVDIPETVNLDSLLRFEVSITNLNGQKEAAKGKIQVWQLKEPSRLLRNRTWNRPDKFILSRVQFEKEFPNDIYDNEGDFSTWEKKKLAWASDFDSTADSLFKLEVTAWSPGRYQYLLETVDAFGEKVEVSGSFLAYDPSSQTVPANEISWMTILKNRLEPGETATVLMGSASKNTTLVYEVLQDQKLLMRKILTASQAQLMQTIPVLESYRGNFTINLAMVKMNRSYQYSKTIEVPWTNKKLDIQFATFRSKLLPGQEEEWLVTIRNNKGEKVAAEMLAGMYDASLDAFVPHSWNLSLFNYFNSLSPWDHTSAFGSRGSIINRYSYPVSYGQSRDYDQLNWFGFERFGGFYQRRVGGMFMKDRAMTLEEAAPKMALQGENEIMSVRETLDEGEKGAPPPSSPPVEKQQQSPPAKIRSDFKETAFFYPQLTTNEKGEIQIRFRIPESLTRWKMMGLAYTKDLSIGDIEKTLVTQKDLMVFPNIPRFFRENDIMQFSVKIANISPTPLSGSAELHFFDALTMKPVDDKVLKTASSLPFTVDGKGNIVLNWSIAIPEGLQAVVYRVAASSGTFSDGEEAAVPVLTNRMLVTESMPLPINGGQTKNFTFKKLYGSGKGSETLRNHKLTLEFSSNPAWYAVQALPYLMEYPYECAEQIFSRYYANSIASYVANSNPKIKAVFENWKSLSPDALKSNLEKNQDLKNVLLEESPWVREATNESERKQRIAILFDLNRMSNELNAALKKLVDMQVSNGGWPWFEGMPESRYITQHIVTGLGHLDHLGVTDIRENPGTFAMLQSAVKYLDARIEESFEKIKKEDKDYLKNDHLGYEDVQYLYARSYFMKDLAIEKSHLEAFNYYKSQAVKFWVSRNNYQKGMIALALHRYAESKTASLVLRSLSETALHNEEMGMYWRDEYRGWFWYQAPIETQALLIEAFDEVLNDTRSVDELKIWLLKQKQTQDWKTTKATTEAVYALLLRGTDLLASDQLASVTVGNQVIDPMKLEGAARPEAGTGYYKMYWTGGEISPAMGKVTVTNPNPTVAWGAMYWQYFEQLDKITPAETPLRLGKQLFREGHSPTGPVLEPISESTPLRAGDKVVVRVELRTDRDMEYVHLRDMRAAAFEPVNVLSGYRWQDGLGYYEATRDASSNFFISYLPKGTYVFEYRLYATQKGEFSNGITTVQCMYAPEFAAHSEGIRVRVE